MIQLTRATLSQPCVTLDKSNLERVCAKCGAKFSSFPGACATCGPSEVAYVCARCGQKTEKTYVQYTAVASKDVALKKEFPADQCPGCGQIYLEAFFVDGLDALARRAPPGCRFIPEHGFQTAKYIEVFSFIGSGDKSTIIRKRANGMSVRYGRQSVAFQRMANEITELDLDDHALTEHPTIRITPPPPYSSEQLRTLLLLLAQVEQSLGDDAWEVVTPVSEMLSVVMRWPADKDRCALALVSAIRKDEHPGAFVNIFRLLELVLERLLDAEISRKRRDRRVGDESFVALAKTYNADLKTRLKRRVESLPIPPTKILADLWHLLRPGEAFNAQQVFQEVVSFRNKHVHQPGADAQEVILPWETPDFGRISQALMDLIIFLLQYDPGGLLGYATKPPT